MKRPRITAAAIIMCATALAAHHTAQAQIPPWEYAPDTTMVTVIGDHRVLPGESAQAYTYTMVSDSTCIVEYLFTECRSNNHLLALQHWSDGRVVHAPAPYLTFNSRTATFPVTAGDTISFYRELRWINPTTRFQGTTNYYSLDTLEWIAHLVRASDGAPIAILDSTGIFPSIIHGAPRIYGSHPIMAVIRYVVPPAASGDSAFIGFTVHANGSGAYDFVRTDNETFNVSKRLTQAFWIDFLSLYSPPAMGKRMVDDFKEYGDTRYTLGVTPESGRGILISFSAPDGESGGASVAIYNAAGQLVFSPYATPGKAGGTGQVRYQFSQAGPYFVALMAGDRIARVQKITIN